MKVLCRLSLSLLIFWFIPNLVLAKDNYPKLANYYLSFFNQSQYSDLSRWDLLVLQPEMVYYQSAFFSYYRQHQPSGKLLAYTYPAMYYRPAVFYDYLGLRNRIYKEIKDNNWWLRNAQGRVVEAWPNMGVVNLSREAWRNFNLDYLDKTFYITKDWDGVFYDMVDSEVSWYDQSGIDIDADGSVDSTKKVNQQWQLAMSNWLTASQERWPNKIITINGNSLAMYQKSVNGRMFETFPTPWEGSGTWSDSMRQYLKRLPSLNQQPNVYIINSAYQTDSQKSLYAQMRFGLASALLGDGYFSFDGGEKSHSEIWWFDEYEADLGGAEGEAVNLSLPQSDSVSAGLWRRDFARGIVLVNSTKQALSVHLPPGQFKRLKGYQDPNINNGQEVEDLSLCPMSGIILLKQKVKQKELVGRQATCFDYQANNQPNSWLERATKQFRRLLRQTKLWFKYFHYGKK